MNIQELMKQAQQMQERMQEQLAETQVEATAGGGMVTVVMNGAKQIMKLTIDPEVVSKEDVDMLQDLIVAAVNDAQRKVDETVTNQMGGLMGGLKMPGLMG
jgi:DNA-binding YbaB/EbfC family protein